MSNMLIFSCLLIGQFLCAFTASLLSLFYPPLAIEKGVSEEIIGLMFISNPLGAIIAATFLGRVLTESNRNIFMFIGLLFQSIGLFLFAITYYQNRVQIIITGFVAGLINGLGKSTYMTPLYAYIPILFPDSIVKKVSIVSISLEIGYMVAPPAGSILFKIGGYTLPFMFFGTLTLILAFTLACLLNLIKTSPQSTQFEDENDSKVQECQTPLPYSQVLSSLDIVMTSMCGFCVAFMFNFMGPINANYFESEYNITPDNIGFYFTLISVSYMVNTFIAGNIKKNQHYYIFGGGMVLGISSMFVGPDTQIVQVEKKLSLTLAGLSAMSGASAYMVIFNIPILNTLLNKKFPSQPVQCANMAAVLFNCSYQMGNLSSPALAGFLQNKYGYPRAVTCMGFMIIFFSLFYIGVIIQKNNSCALQNQIDIVHVDKEKKNFQEIENTNILYISK